MCGWAGDQGVPVHLHVVVVGPAYALALQPAACLQRGRVRRAHKTHPACKGVVVGLHAAVRTQRTLGAAIARPFEACDGNLYLFEGRTKNDAGRWQRGWAGEKREGLLFVMATF